MPSLQQMAGGHPQQQMQSEQPVQAPMQQEPMAGEQIAEQQDPNQATPEEQASYEKFVMAAMKSLYDNPKTQKAIESRLRAGVREPAETIANVATMLVIQIDKRFDEARDPIPDTMILPAAAEITEQIAEYANAKNIIKADQNLLNDAGKIVVGDLLEYYGASPEEIQELMSQNPELVAQYQQEDAAVQPPEQQAMAQEQSAPMQAPPQQDMSEG